MQEPGVIVIDIGKTLSKVTLCSGGAVVARRERVNRVVEQDGVRVLDVDGIERWLAGAIGDLARLGPVGAIVPVAHGAAAAIVRDGKLAFAPLDYEQEIPGPIRAEYDCERDPFALIGSPALPAGLNLGAQLFWLERSQPARFDGKSRILTWPQYWSWLLSGVAACEVSSLGCHTDLWRPLEGKFSALATRRRWAERLGPLRPAGDVLGPITPKWAQRTGLDPSTPVLCGVHDSNAALLAVRGIEAIAVGDATVLSTGTWFVALRAPAEGERIDPSLLPENRDCLVNVDVQGRPVPSARFMGGREIQLLCAEGGVRIDDPAGQPALLAALATIVKERRMILPTMVPGVGPFPDAGPAWIDAPESSAARAACVALYAALVSDAMLDLVQARGALVIEGRFARAEAFTRALASLRPDLRLLVVEGELDVALGAARLVDPAMASPLRLVEVAPLDRALVDYRAEWRARIDTRAHQKLGKSAESPQ